MLHRHFIISSSSNGVHNIPNNEVHFIPHDYTNVNIIIDTIIGSPTFNIPILWIDFSDILERYIISCGDIITKINADSFNGLDITSIFLPNSITEIDTYALNCYYLESIIYDGTIEEWNLIKKYDFWCDNSKPVIYCTDGTIEL